MIEELWELKKNFNKYLVSKEFEKKEGIDRDRCSYTWENLYIQYYENRPFWKGTNFNEYKEEYNIIYKGMICRISGDVLFNFKSKEDGAVGRGKKFEHYESLLKKEPEFSEKEREYYLEILRFCNKMNYTLHNFGLMPVDGNLQKFKEIKCNWDRMDRFVYFVNEYFKDNDQFVFFSNYRDKEKKEKKIKEDREKIKKFFSEFDKSIYKYCQEMYLIADNKYIDDLVEFGKQEINNGKVVVRYMELAIEYWIKKDKILSQKHLLEEGEVLNERIFYK